MAAGHALFCASSLGVDDPKCVPTTLPVVTTLPVGLPQESQYSAFLEILGYALFAFCLFCLYFFILCLYKVIWGYSLYYSFRFAFCGAQRVMYDRTVRLGASLFLTPVNVVLPTQTAQASNPTDSSTPLPMLVLSSPESPIYSDPATHGDHSLGMVVVVES
jgi:hypothetical protein